MSKFTLKCSLATLAVVFAAATVDIAEAAGNMRKQRSGSGQMMRLGGPANVTPATNVGIVDRTGGPVLRTRSEIELFFQQQRESRGPG